MMTAKHSKSVIVPLTRIDRKTGRPYVRPKEVSEEIEAALDLRLEEAFSLACAGHLRPQTLVYLMRNFRPNRSNPAYDALIVAFYSRLERSGDRLLLGLTETKREWVQSEVVKKVTEWLSDDRMDIFECSFKTGAERLFLTEIGKVRRRTQAEVSQEDLVDAEDDLTGEEMAGALAIRHAGSARPLVEVRSELLEIWEKLTAKERLAIAYVEQLGLTEKEAGERIGCSPRNVRYLIENVRTKARGEPKRARGVRESVKR